MFTHAQKATWSTDPNYANLPLRVFNGEILQNSSFDVLSKLRKNPFETVFEAREMAMCPSANLDYDNNAENVAIIYQIGPGCSTGVGVRRMVVYYIVKYLPLIVTFSLIVTFIWRFFISK